MLFLVMLSWIITLLSIIFAILTKELFAGAVVPFNIALSLYATYKYVRTIRGE